MGRSRWARYRGESGHVESPGNVDSTPINTAHTAQHSTIMRLAQGPSAICISSLCPKKRIMLSGVTCLILGCLTCLSPRALHLPHSFFLLRHKNTQQNRHNKSNSGEHFVDEKRYQRPVCYDQQQIGRNPRHTTPKDNADIL